MIDKGQAMKGHVLFCQSVTYNMSYEQAQVLGNVSH